MPFGSKADPSGAPNLDFDLIYEQAIKPATERAGMDLVRGCEERFGNPIQLSTIDWLLLCDFAVVDLTTDDPNVFYLLGMRNAVRADSTIAILAAHHASRFAASFVGALSYEPGPNNSFTSREASLLQESLVARLVELRKAAANREAKNSAVLQMLDGDRVPEIARLKTDVFRDRARYSNELKSALALARTKGGASELERIEKRLGRLDDNEIGVLIDLLLSYRAVSAWENMLHLFDRMPAILQRTVLVREQYAFALNRLGRWQEAVTILAEVVAEHGPSSETLAILGRVYKDLWVKTEKSGNASLADEHLGKAIDCYVRGFEADWRDAYPGINAVTLLDIQGTPEAERKKTELLPIVMFAVQQRLKRTQPDYWDYATLVEMAVLGSVEKEARSRLSDALSHVREAWEPEATANNLSLISSARKKRGFNQPWFDDIISSLKSRASRPK
jgi:tetratricopeptide (TPR) repeat protein